MIYGSVCSGIEAATMAWHLLGWKASFFSEIDKFPRQVLEHHYPDTPLHGDFTTIQKGDYEPIELLVGGTPCQSFSVAGLRAGLADPRGNLMLEFGALAQRLQPRWLVWENVPGVLSSNSGKDFGSFLAMLAELGYGFSYRVLDAQYFGVPQRRRRVFVVGCLGDWRSAAAVLFERHSLQGNTAPSRKKGEEVAGTLTTRTGISRNNAEECVASTLLARSGGFDLDTEAAVVHTFDRQSSAEYGTESVATPQVASGKPTIGTLMANAGTKLWLGNQEALSGDYHILQPTYGIPGNWIGRKPENGGNAVEPMPDVAPCLTKTDQHGVAYPIDSMGFGRYGDKDDLRRGLGIGEPTDPSFTITKAHSHAVAHPQIVHGTQDPCHSYIAFAQGRNNGGENVLIQSMAVRRLTPEECEALQGFPRSYTKISDKTADGPRYKALGNSMAVPVMHWIGKRIQMIGELIS